MNLDTLKNKTTKNARILLKNIQQEFDFEKYFTKKAIKEIDNLFEKADKSMTFDVLDELENVHKCRKFAFCLKDLVRLHVSIYIFTHTVLLEIFLNEGYSIQLDRRYSTFSKKVQNLWNFLFDEFKKDAYKINIKNLEEKK